ncbi:MAG: Glycoside hydrolase family 9, partial [Parcubacteria group bacterium GW2011_GWA2_47_12]
MKIPYQWLGAVFISIFAVIVIPSMAVGQVSNYDFGFGEDSIFAPSFSVDLKINGSNGPVEVSAGERVVVSWLTEGAAKCRSNFSSRDMTMRNTVAGRVTRSVTVRFACINDARERLDDFVLVNVRGTAPAVVPTLPPQAITDTPPVSAQPSITAPTTSTNTSIPADQTAGFVPDLFKISPCPALGNFGDVTDDKKITKKDLDVIRSVILGLSSFSNDAQKKNADVNGDGKVDTLDIQFIRRYLINADTSFPVCASDAGSIPPLVTTTTISECGTIQKGGTYSIVSDLSSPSGSCIQVKDTTDVTIACDGKKTVSSVEFSNIQRFSLKNCILSGPKNNPLTILNSTDGEISGNTLTHGWVHVEGTKNLIVRDNTFSSTLYQQYHTDNTLIERNIFTFDSTKAHSPSVVANISLNNGTNNRILGNTTDGGSNGIFNNLGTPGADDSIVLYNQTGAIVENNTLQNVWDCAIENSGTLERSFIKNNTIKNVGYCGIGGWYWSNWKNNTVSGNTVEDAPRLFQFGRDYGIRSGENGVYFSDNIFERNTFLKPRLSGIFTSGADSGSSSFSIQKFLAISTSGLTDDERLPSGNEFFLSNNRFTANDFSTSRSAPTFSIGVVDGGGNICGTTPSGYPLKCGTVSVNVQTNAPTTSTYTSVADLPDSFEKPLVCGQKGDINNDGRITK